MDIYRSTDAAMRMLKYLYGEFGDWALVLAAYNTGVGKVSEAVRRAGTKDYWKVKDYLPAETQRYVPAFVAAAYISKYHAHHNLQPSNYGSFSTDLRSIRIHQRISFGEIARITGLPLSKLAELNPGFVQGVIPANEKGYYLLLPNEKASLLLRDYLGGLEAQKLLKSGDIVRMTYVVSKEHTLEEIAKLFNTDVASIKKWNYLQDDEIAIRQELLLYLPKSFLLNRA
jgi:membrane-bound lytic murein transglycosylase D